MKSTKYHYRVLMIKDLFQIMRFIRQLTFIKTLKNRFSQMIIKKRRFKKILINNQGFTQLKIGAYKSIIDGQVKQGAHQQHCRRGYQDILKKTEIKPKPTYKTKTSEQKTAKATIFCAQKLVRGKIFCFAFLKKIKQSC